MERRCDLGTYARIDCALSVIEFTLCIDESLGYRVECAVYIFPNIPTAVSHSVIAFKFFQTRRSEDCAYYISQAYGAPGGVTKAPSTEYSTNVQIILESSATGVYNSNSLWFFIES